MLARDLVIIGFIVLTAPDGGTVDINPKRIVTLRPPTGNHHSGVGCVIDTSNGKYTGVKEDCATVLKKFNDGIDRSEKAP